MKGNLDAGNLQLESRMREIRQSGSEGGAGSSIPVPTPIFSRTIAGQFYAE